jgi:hypothetical protein
MKIMWCNLRFLFQSWSYWKKTNLGRWFSEFNYKTLIVPVLRNYVAKIYGGMEALFHAFLNSALNSGQTSAARPGICAQYIPFHKKRREFFAPELLWKLRTK